jgi:excisionase family DNA binding protein
VRALLEGCGFVFTADLDAARAAEWLTALRRPAAPRAELPGGVADFTPAEAARLLGVSGAAVRAAVKRHRLAATGQGKARRLPRATVLALLDRAAGSLAPETANHYVRAVRSFLRWMVRVAKRLPDNPLESLPLVNSQVDQRHARRELTADELRRLLAVTRGSSRSYRGLTGPDRFHLYATACGTAFRARGLAGLTPESFDLDGTPPTATLAARRNKSRVLKVQPLPPDLADLLRGYLAARPVGEPVWGGTWARDHRGAEMLRGDLEAAGIPYTVEGPDGPLHADFHALRHTYLTLGGRAGIDLRTLQELAGHSTPVLTARYSHRRLHDLAGAVERLPDFLPGAGDGSEEARARLAAGTNYIPPPQSTGAYTALTRNPDTACDPVGADETAGQEEGRKQAGRNPLDSQRVAAGCDRLRLIETSEGDGTRTRNHRIDSRVPPCAVASRNQLLAQNLCQEVGQPEGDHFSHILLSFPVVSSLFRTILYQRHPPAVPGNALQPS